MDILRDPICPFITLCTHPADIFYFFSKSCNLRYYMKRLNFPYSSSTDPEKMPVKDLILSAFFQVFFDKLASGLILAFVHCDRIHKQLKSWCQRLSSIQAQINDDAGKKQWLRLLMDLACEVIELLDEMALFQGSEDLKETTRKILAYECIPGIASNYTTWKEEDIIQLPGMYRGKSNKWKKKHPPKHGRDVRTSHKSEEDIIGLSTLTEDDQFIDSLLDHLASRITALMSERKTDYRKEINEEETPAHKHEHIHKKQPSPLHKGEGMKTSVELNIKSSTSATPDSTTSGKITELQTYMDKRFVELQKMLHRVINCIETRDTSPICAQDRKRRCAPKLPPAKRQRTQGPEVAKYPYNPPACNVPSPTMVDATTNSPTLFFCSFLL